MDSYFTQYFAISHFPSYLPINSDALHPLPIPPCILGPPFHLGMTVGTVCSFFLPFVTKKLLFSSQSCGLEASSEVIENQELSMGDVHGRRSGNKGFSSYDANASDANQSIYKNYSKYHHVKVEDSCNNQTQSAQKSI